jgi:hypothetical protein
MPLIRSLKLVFSLVIFIFYKKNLRLDLFMMLLLGMIIVAKLVLFLLAFPSFLPSMIYQKHDFYYILKNPTYNMSSFIIGIFFGMINYCIQKSYNCKRLKNEKRSFLTIPHGFILFFRRSATVIKVIMTSVLSFVFLIMISIGFVFI